MGTGSLSGEILVTPNAPVTDRPPAVGGEGDEKSMVRADEREACASLVETVELVDPSGLTKKEQLRIYSILQKAADLIRSR